MSTDWGGTDRSRSKLCVGKPSQELETSIAFRCKTDKTNFVAPFHPEHFPHAVRRLLYTPTVIGVPPKGYDTRGHTGKVEGLPQFYEIHSH
ncbi:hypothetical protein NIIDNTM18_09010 [Mycolicibacterium litorale]|uniref:Uncharacterized protein n=1 Tax=Mycolicibacterium litorale TaxID=758802 RepID=A0A6S6NWR2_9MYCO|nr:hypothetical protein NIIDNTM18_09010 [Mycolicibacterium litorale]